jgi:hypothetical protein
MMAHAASMSFYSLKRQVSAWYERPMHLAAHAALQIKIHSQIQAWASKQVMQFTNAAASLAKLLRLAHHQ